MRDDVLDQVRRSLRHAPRAARGTKPPALAAKCHQLVLAAVAAVQAQEAVRQDAALEECIELVFDEGRQARTCGGLHVGEEGLGVLLHQAVQRGLLGPVALVVDRGTIRRPMARTGLPTDGLHALLTRYCISAADRARTVQAAVARDAKASDLVQPGHVFPLRAQEGGVLMRAGHTEAGCDLAGMAGLSPASVICEVMKDDGTMARLPDLMAFAETHGLKIGTIADLIEYRSRHETLIERVGRRPLVTAQGAFDCSAFRDRTGGLHLALTKGQWSEADEVLVRVHEPLSVMDLLDIGGPCQHSWPLPRALAKLQQSECGAALLLNCGEDGAALVPHVLPPAPAEARPPAQMDLRTYGIGAQILRELGIAKMRLLGSPRRMPSMTGYGLEVTGWLAAETP